MTGTGYAVTSAVSSIVTGLFGVLVYKWRARVDMESREEGFDIETKRQALTAQNIPLKLLEEQLNKRETELQQIRSDDKKERDAYLDTLGGIRSTMEKISSTLDRQAQTQSDHAHRVESRLDDVDNRLLVMETVMGVKAAS